MAHEAWRDKSLAALAAIIADSESPDLTCCPAKIIYRIRHATWVGRIAMITKGRQGGHGQRSPAARGAACAKGAVKEHPPQA